MIDFANHAESIVNDRKVAETEKVHLEQAEGFYLGGWELSGNRAFGGNFKREEFN